MRGERPEACSTYHSLPIPRLSPLASRLSPLAPRPSSLAPRPSSLAPRPSPLALAPHPSPLTLQVVLGQGLEHLARETARKELSAGQVGMVRIVKGFVAQP